MARTDPQVNVRMPSDLKERLEEASSGSGRSLTAEIVQRLEQSFEPSAASGPVDRRAEIDALAKIAEALAHSAGLLTGQITGAAAVIELQGNLPEGSFSSGIEAERRKLISQLSKFDKAIKALG